MAKTKWHVAALVLVLVAAGCVRNVEVQRNTSTPVPALSTATSAMTVAPTLPPTVTPTPTQAVPTHTAAPRPTNTVTPTQTPQAPTATHTPEPQVPTATQPASTPTAEPSVVRIRFAPGATSATLTGRIQRTEEGGVEFGTEYLVRAFAGQTMSVAITSPNNDVLLTIVGADGVPLKRYVDGEAQWRGQLYATQDYSIIPTSVGSTTDYALAVSISALWLSEPVRIQFGAGATSQTIQGDITPGLVARYTLRALRGQRLEASVTPALSISLAVEGHDGSFWSGSADGGRLTVDSLPTTQDYVITLALVPTAELAHYTLEVTATGAGSSD